jgi:hypothetical protein
MAYFILDKSGEDGVAFSVPEKPLALAHPGLGDGQGCSRARRRRGASMTAALDPADR